MARPRRWPTRSSMRRGQAGSATASSGSNRSRSRSGSARVRSATRRSEAARARAETRRRALFQFWVDRGPARAGQPLLKAAHTRRVRTLRTLRDLELDAVVLVEIAVPAALDCAEVDEDVRAVVLLDEAIALLRAEPFHGASRHVPSLLSYTGADDTDELLRLVEGTD